MAAEVPGRLAGGEFEMVCVPSFTGAARNVTAAALAAAALLLPSAVGAAGAASSPGGAPCSGEARACVDLSTQQAWLMRNGAVVYGPVPVATGMPSAPTAAGTFRVTWKDLHHRSIEFNNAPMPYSVFFNGGDAFHEDNVAVPSHGCVHLTPAAARTFYTTLHDRDVVQVVR
jgi:hypothetical protein